MAYVTTEYKVNKEKRTVVCIITTYNDVPERLAKYGLGDEDYDEITEVRIYKGKAKCAPEDTWDETYGFFTNFKFINFSNDIFNANI